MKRRWKNTYNPLTNPCSAVISDPVLVLILFFYLPAGYSQRVFPWILLGARLPEDSPTPAFLPCGKDLFYSFFLSKKD